MTIAYRTAYASPAMPTYTRGWWLNIPAGTQVGDMMIAVSRFQSRGNIYDSANGSYAGYGSGGWTRMVSFVTVGATYSMVFCVDWKIATQADVNRAGQTDLANAGPVYDTLDNPYNGSGTLLVYSGVASLINAAKSDPPAANTGDVVTPSINIDRNNAWLLGVFMSEAGGGPSDWSVQPPGMNTRVRFNNTNNSFFATLFADEVRSAGATGTRTATYNRTDNRGAGWAVELVPSNTGPSAVPAVTAPGAGSLVNTTAAITWNPATDPDGDALHYYVELTRDNGVSWTRILNNVQSGVTYDFSAVAASTACRVRVLAADTSEALSPSWTEGPTFTIYHNVAPTAATAQTPVNNSTVDRAVVQRFSWLFNDPDAGDGQSKFDLRYRVGAGAWTTVSQTTTNRFYDMPAGTLAAGTYEWQVLTYDVQGVAATAWSASSFVTFANVPAGPTITNPANNGTVATPTGTVDWNYPTQQAYQVRKLADNAGVPADPSVPANVYFDTGQVISTTARNVALDYPVNNRYEHVQVRIQDGGLWSTWTSSRVQVSYTAPAVPTIVATPDPTNGRVTLVVTSPTPTGSQPAIANTEIWRTNTNGFEGGFKRIAIVAANATYYDYSAAGNSDLQYYIVSVGTTGTKTQSATITTNLALHGIWLGDPKDPTTLHQFQWDGEGRSVLFEPEVSLNQYVGRKFPIAEFGTTAKESVRLPLPLDNDTGDRVAFQKLVRRLAPLLYRDGRGRKAYCILQSENMADTVYGGKVDFAIYSIDYDESV